MKTPGGGGFGPIEDSKSEEGLKQENIKRYVERGTVFNYLQSQESA